MFKGILIVATIVAGSMVQAETFVCMGFGKYASAFATQVVTPEWPKKSQVVLADTITNNSGTRILVDIDKSNSDGTEYLEITVINMSAQGVVSSLYAKGSIKDEVILGEQVGIDKKGGSAITCLPVHGSK